MEDESALTEVVKTRVTAEDKQRLEMMALDSGLSQSRLMRELIRNGVVRGPVIVADVEAAQSAKKEATK